MCQDARQATSWHIETRCTQKPIVSTTDISTCLCVKIENSHVRKPCAVCRHLISSCGVQLEKQGKRKRKRRKGKRRERKDERKRKRKSRNTNSSGTKPTFNSLSLLVPQSREAIWIVLRLLWSSKHKGRAATLYAVSKARSLFICNLGGESC